MAVTQESLFRISFAPQNESESEVSFWEFHNIDSSYNFERIDIPFWRDFLTHHWALAFYAAGIYLVTIFGLEKYMRGRSAYDLKTPLILWNAGLGIFSIVGFVRTVPPMVKYTTGLDGIHESICTRDYTDPPVAFWGLAFAISKYIELGDTIFISLRKRPLQVIQWYHHIATLIVVWLTLPTAEPVGRWFVVINYGVHSVMYPYFALKMAGVNVPKTIAQAITTVQFVQMLVGFMLNAVTIGLIAMGYPCYRTSISIWSFVAVYGTFIILFGKLFTSTVLKRSSKQQQVAKKAL